ncbi:MAG: D-cysteine desulfhydrase family protein [Fimbriimonadaceae bacterium]|nr:D-cysteine desulfhydrase family protein [Fimbriimonadaceae bacterium]
MPTVPEKVDLIVTPTPLHALPNLSKELGIDLWIKRDDLTGFALGGNKGRKLEFLIAEALRQGAEVVVGMGASQSNFLRQLAAACAKYGLRSAAAVMGLPYYAAAGRPAIDYVPDSSGGNVLADEIFGMDVRLFPDGDWDQLEAYAEAIAHEYQAIGLKTFEIPIGGSSVLGAYSFYLAAQEVMAQSAEPFDTIVTASSSGSTHAGLAFAFAGSSTKVIGISADPDPDEVLQHDVHELTIGLGELTGQPKNLRYEDLDLRMDYFGEGYSIPSPEGNRAILKVARSEGILLDPTYSGKAFAGLMDMVGKGELKGRVLFWHTGGAVTLFATPKNLLIVD